MNGIAKFALLAAVSLFGVTGAGPIAFAQRDPSGNESGYWNIYASINGGDIWLDDKAGIDPAARKLDRQGQAVIAALKRCRIVGELDDSSQFPSFRRNLLLVHSAPFRSTQAAGIELVRAKSCGMIGYTKYSKRVEPGPGED